MTMLKTAFVIFVLAGSALAFRQDVKLVAEAVNNLDEEASNVQRVAEEVAEASFVERVNNLDEEASNVQRVAEEVAEASFVERVNNLDEEASNVQRVAEEAAEASKMVVDGGVEEVSMMAGSAQASSPQEGSCLALVDLYEENCRAAKTEDVCKNYDHRCFWGQAYETGKCWNHKKGDEGCVHTNSKSYCKDQPECFWVQSDDKGYQDLCLARVPTWEDECTAHSIDACPFESHCFKRGGYETGKCWGKASGSEEDCRLWNAKSDCEAETGSLGSSTGSLAMGMPAFPTVGKCFWGQGYEKGKCLTHTLESDSYFHIALSMCLKHYTKEGCPDQSCYWEE